MENQIFNKSGRTFWLSIFLFLSIIPGGSQTNEYVYQTPKKLNDGWEISSLDKEGIDKEAIEEISGIIADIDSYDNVLSMLIVKNGKLVHEVYSPYCQRNTLHWMASIIKTITSTRWIFPAPVSTLLSKGPSKLSFRDKATSIPEVHRSSLRVS